MPHKLFLAPCEPYGEIPSFFDWALYDLKGLRVAGGRSVELQDVAQMLMQNGADGVKAILVWPANLSFRTTVSIPGRNTRYLQQALAFAVEDKVAADIDQLHFAAGKSIKGKLPVHCIERELLRNIYDQVLDAKPDINLGAAFVGADMMPLEEFDMVLSIEGQWATIKTPSEAVKIQTQNLPAFLDSIFLAPQEDEGKSRRVKVYEHNADDSDHKILIAEIEQYPNVELEVEALSISGLDLLAESYFHTGAPDIDLCQGELKVQAENSGNLKQWGAVAAVVALAFFIQVGVFVAKGLHFSQQADLIGESALTAYKQAVPASRNVSVSRLARIIKGKLRESEGQTADAGFLTLLGEAGYQFQQRKGKSNISFTSLSYSAQRGELTIELTARTFEEMDQLKNAIVASGLNAKISSAVQEEQYYRGRLSVSAG